MPVPDPHGHEIERVDAFREDRVQARAATLQRGKREPVPYTHALFKCLRYMHVYLVQTVSPSIGNNETV